MYDFHHVQKDGILLKEYLFARTTPSSDRGQRAIENALGARLVNAQLPPVPSASSQSQSPSSLE